MKKVKLDYGKKGLCINVNDDAEIILPKYQSPLSNPQTTLKDKLYCPDFGIGLNQLTKNKNTVAIAHTDITRATPNHIILPVLINELLNNGIKKENICLINMTGSHRPQTREELIQMLGEEIVNSYKCIQHNSFDNTTLELAGYMSDGNPLFVNKYFLNADLKIITGFVEPHFFAGFSGGPKAILPGLSDITSIMRNHNAIRIANRKSTWGVTEGNPVWDNINEGCSIVNPDFLINVALNTEAEISAIFTGEWQKAHKKGYEYVRENAMRKVEKLYDIVITTNSGYPLDMNLYQCVKGISCAAEIVKDNGIIIMAGECSDGIPYNSPYDKILKMADSPEKLFDLIINSNEVIPEQWQVQIQTRIQKRAKVYIYSHCLTDDQISKALLLPCRDIEKLINKKGASVAVLPKGPQTIPYIR